MKHRQILSDINASNPAEDCQRHGMTRYWLDKYLLGQRPMKPQANTACQRQRLVDYLMLHHRITPLEARQWCDLMNLAAQVKELRQAGNNIVTHWATEDTPLGKHRIARYVLIPSN